MRAWIAIASLLLCAGCATGARQATSREVQFRNGSAGVTLSATLTTPQNSGARPAIVLITGAGPQDRDETIAGQRPFAVLAEQLSARGFIVLRYDDRGVGASSGDFAAATLHDFASDAAAAFAFLRAQPRVDRRRVGLIGHSEGGLAAALAAQSHPDDVAFVVLLATPALNGEQSYYLQDAAEARGLGADEGAIARSHDRKAAMFRVLIEEPSPERAAPRLRAAMNAIELMPEERAAIEAAGVDINAEIEQQVRLLNTEAQRVFLRYEPAPTLRALDVPVLAVFGGTDVQVPAQANEELTAAALEHCPRSTVETLPDLNHLFQVSASGLPRDYASGATPMAPPVIDLVGDWILNRGALNCG
jgi:pimeloyl-ACP methyl ester carboxylesterase